MTKKVIEMVKGTGKRMKIHGSELIKYTFERLRFEPEPSA